MFKPTHHIVGAGGNAGRLLARCLEPHYDVCGNEQSEYAAKLATVPLEPQCPGWSQADMLWPVPDKAVAKYADCDLWPHPDPAVIKLCQDKGKTALALKDLAPIRYWERDFVGAGGKGAKLMQEFLPGKNYSVELIYWHGVLKAHFSKERLGYDLNGNSEPNHQFGTSMVSVCIWDQNLINLAVEAVLRVHDGKTPHGVFGVDFKEDSKGIPKVTEINAGRFLTASYIYYYTWYNLPYFLSKLFLEGYEIEITDYPLGMMVVRGFDTEPWTGHRLEFK